MKPTISDIALTLAVIAGFYSLYIWDTPHIAALLLISNAYWITWQDGTIEKQRLIMNLQTATIDMQRDRILDMEERKEQA